MADLRGRVLLRFSATALAIAAVAWCSDVPVGDPSADGALRLSWRARARVERCRDRSPQELERLPAHLRQTRDCRNVPIDYHLALTIDDTPVLDEIVRHHGVRASRPLFVDRTVAVAPGKRHVGLRWTPQLAGLDPAELPPDIAPQALDLEIDVEPGSIELITLDGELHIVPRAEVSLEEEDSHA